VKVPGFFLKVTCNVLPILALYWVGLMTAFIHKPMQNDGLGRPNHPVGRLAVVAEWKNQHRKQLK
jgi:hypothetical protein